MAFFRAPELNRLKRKSYESVHARTWVLGHVGAKH